MDTETNVFLSRAKDDLLTLDFLAYHCPDEPWTPIFAEDVVIVGEALSPSNHISQMLTKQARYAEAGIEEYWGSTARSRRPPDRRLHGNVQDRRILIGLIRRYSAGPGRSELSHARCSAIGTGEQGIAE
ncbi:hypothetical protein [Nocardia mangyaensis]|uniref:hypothetical protein n=1 Tax=Nocardia mangyaensis TaxID=2213200 RepID=UPI0012EB55DE|nr:hypothetical protein [Nocardia mangyaensis]